MNSFVTTHAFIVITCQRFTFYLNISIIRAYQVTPHNKILNNDNWLKIKQDILTYTNVMLHLILLQT